MASIITLINGIKTLVNSIKETNGVTDANKIISTGNDGKIHASFLSNSSSPIFHAKSYMRLYEDFLYNTGSIPTLASGTSAYVGTINVSATDTGGNPGICVLNTGTTATGSCRLGVTASDTFNRILLGFGTWETETLIKIVSLSTSTEAFYVVCGFNDTSTNIFIDGLFFYYDLNNPNWVIRSYSNSVVTSFITNIIVNPNIWYKLGIKINSNATEVLYFINDVLVHTETTNIPTGSNRQTSWLVTNNKTVGTTNRTIMVDYVEILNIFTTTR